MSFSPSLYLVADHLIVANGGRGIVIMIEGRGCSGNDGGEGGVVAMEGMVMVERRLWWYIMMEGRAGVWYWKLC